MTDILGELDCLCSLSITSFMNINPMCRPTFITTGEVTLKIK